MASLELLHRRLDQVARGLEASGEGLALLALGSMGREQGRVDEWSDLDFFAVVRPGSKGRFLTHLAWLERGAGLDWCFRNTVDGFKLLWADGVFAEMAVFEPDELQRIPFAPGRAVWVAPGFDAGLLEPKSRAGRVEPGDEGAAREELLSCLYVGLARYRRGEKLSAFRFVQGHCLERFLELVHRGDAAGGEPDPYDRTRRFERRYPQAAALLPKLLGGYEATPAAARALLEWLESTGPVNVPLARRVRELIGVDVAAFDAAVRAAGFTELLDREWSPGEVVPVHSHPFDSRAVVTRGVLWLTVGADTRQLRAGDTFDLPRGTLHEERYGPEGATYHVARRT